MLTAMADPHFRPCRPGDIDAALPLIISSGPEAFGYVFNDQSEDQLAAFLRRAFQEKGSEFSFQQHVAIDVGGEVMGVGALRFSHQTAGFSLRALSLMLRHYGLIAGLRTAIRGLRTEAIIKPPPKKVAYLYQLGVRPEQRGRGLGRALIAHLIQRAEDLGYLRIGLSVSIENPRAQTLYEQLGFTVIREYSSALRSDFGHVPGQRYMELDLSNTR